MSDKTVYRELTKLVEKHKGCLTTKERDYIVKDDWKSSNFYVLPKIHKSKPIAEKFAETNAEYAEMDAPDDLKGRPITAGPKTPTRGLSELLEKILAPLVPHLKTYVKDDRDFLSRIPRNIDYECDLISWDVVSLYTSIPHDLGIEALRYWLTKYKTLVPPRFTTDFIIEAALFILQNNNFVFDGVYYHQEVGSAMGTVFAPPYACLTVGYLEETKLQTTILPRYFSPDDCSLIIKLLLRYIDDGFAPWPRRLNLNDFIEAINSLHPSIKFTLERSTYEIRNGRRCQVLYFLDVTVILYESGEIETDIHYKSTNSHDYLRYNSHHPTHTKNNIVYGLAKKVVEFVSNYDNEEERMNELSGWLRACGFPENVIRKGIHDARLQGPGPNPKHKKRTLPFVTTHSSNMNSQNIVELSNQLLDNVEDERLITAFNNTKVVLAQRQPPNLLRQISRAEFTSQPSESSPPGIYTCTRPNCDLCKLILQPCTSFMTSNGTEWVVRSRITCQSKMVIYFLKCLSCNEFETYSGKAKHIRKRTNNHISHIRTGHTDDIFDHHVRRCIPNLIEPFFKMYVFLEVFDESLLDAYEKHIHNLKLDTMNR